MANEVGEQCFRSQGKKRLSTMSESQLKYFCFGSQGSQRKDGLGHRFRGLARDKRPLLIAPLIASLLGSLKVEKMHVCEGSKVWM